MEPSALAAATEVQAEPKERKKIHFAVPSTDPTQLDPRQVEMIRRRRPTPATLFRVADQTSPEDDQSTHQWVVGENGVLKPKRVNPNVYQPPSLRAVQKMAEAQMQHLGVYPPLEDFEGEEYEDYHHWHAEEEEEGEEEEEEKEKPPTDQQDTTDPGQSEKALRVTETAKDRQDDEKDAGEGKEAEEEQKTKEESRRGSD